MKEQIRKFLIDIDEYKSYLNDLSDDTEADRMFEYGEIVMLSRILDALKIDMPTYKKQLNKLAQKYVYNLSDRGLL
ncbi:hypothetical protein EOM09_03755 [bacterium]|nr:hypothetical protein [bacterium]